MKNTHLNFPHFLPHTHFWTPRSSTRTSQKAYDKVKIALHLNRPTCLVAGAGGHSTCNLLQRHFSFAAAAATPTAAAANMSVTLEVPGAREQEEARKARKTPPGTVRKTARKTRSFPFLFFLGEGGKGGNNIVEVVPTTYYNYVRRCVHYSWEGVESLEKTGFFSRPFLPPSSSFQSKSTTYVLRFLTRIRKRIPCVQCSSALRCPESASSQKFHGMESTSRWVYPYHLVHSLPSHLKCLTSV